MRWPWDESEATHPLHMHPMLALGGVHLIGLAQIVPSLQSVCVCVCEGGGHSTTIYCQLPIHTLAPPIISYFLPTLPLPTLPPLSPNLPVTTVHDCCLCCLKPHPLHQPLPTLPPLSPNLPVSPLYKTAASVVLKLKPHPLHQPEHDAAIPLHTTLQHVAHHKTGRNWEQEGLKECQVSR